MDHAAISAGWEPGLVLLSCMIAVFASYVALELAGQLTRAGEPMLALWLCGGGVVMSAGMLVFHTSVPLSYDVPLMLEITESLALNDATSTTAACATAS